tara:strand:- start:235 stop:639 length:405 start_codon:yes stop_codon:yes gene_type:complete
MNQKQMKQLIKVIFEQCSSTHASGSKEYANDNHNIFANFERVADRLDLSKQEALIVYLLKHIDGIISHVKGHKSQREDVRGRITDAIVYLCILWAMEESDNLAGIDEDVSAEAHMAKFTSSSTDIPGFAEEQNE